MKHTHSSTLRVVPRGACQAVTGETLPAGTARLAQNVRQADEALQVVGNPATVGCIGAGHRLIAIDGAHFITIYDGKLWADGNAVTLVDGDFVNAHVVGRLLVVATTAGITHLLRGDTGYTVLNPADAIASLTIGASNMPALTTTIAPQTFAQPYSRWQNPLNASDVASLSATLRSVWNALAADARSRELYTGPIMVRYGVRMHDDNYLWLSPAMRLDGNTALNANALRSAVTDDGSHYTGIDTTTVAMQAFVTSVTVNGGIGAAWKSLVKAVDVLATDAASVVATGSGIAYRAVTDNNRAAWLEWGMPARAASEVTSQLAQSAWHVIASTTDLDALNRHQWVPDAIRPDITLSADQAEQLASRESATGVVATATAAGRLYVGTDDGRVTMSVAGNALVTEQQVTIADQSLLALAAVSRSLYSGGFGRYPVYVFTTHGIYALPLTSGNRLSTPRLVSRAVIAAGTWPVEGDRDIYFLSHRGTLCRLRGSTVTAVLRDTGVRGMAWDDAHSELWLLTTDGRVLAIDNTDHYSERSVAATQLYDDVTHAIAIDAGGTCRDLCTEVPGTMAVAYLSHPIALNSWFDTVPRRVLWNVDGEGLDLTLRLRGARGVNCHGFEVNSMRVHGALHTPVSLSVVAQPLRTVRLSIDGTAPSGTLVLPTHLRYNSLI